MSPVFPVMLPVYRLASIVQPIISVQLTSRCVSLGLKACLQDTHHVRIPFSIFTLPPNLAHILSASVMHLGSILTYM